MKNCFKCKIEKELSEFGKDNQKLDGLRTYCKICTRKSNSEQKKRNPEYYVVYAKKYRELNRELLRLKSKETFIRDRDKRLKQGKESYYKNQDEIAKRRKVKRDSPEARIKENQRQKEWRNSNPELYRQYVRTWQKKNREKNNAHAKVHRAVENGTIIRGKSCMECGMNAKTEGHHEDYSKPLEVIWLCRLCHSKKIEKVKV